MTHRPRLDDPIVGVAGTQPPGGLPQPVRRPPGEAEEGADTRQGSRHPWHRPRRVPSVQCHRPRKRHVMWALLLCYFITAFETLNPQENTKPQTLNPKPLALSDFKAYCLKRRAA